MPTFLDDDTPSSAAQSDVALSTSYDHHHVKGHLVPATDADILEIVITDDNFSTVETGASDYGWHQYDIATTARDAADDSLVLNRLAMDSAAGSGIFFDIWVTGANDSGDETNFYWSILYVQDTAGTWVHGRGGGTYQIASAINGLRFRFQSGNISTGYIAVFGEPNS